MMGWCSGTYIFDKVCELTLEDKPIDAEKLLEDIIIELEDLDWDCQSDSSYYDHPVVRKVMKKIHPRWFDEE